MPQVTFDECKPESESSSQTVDLKRSANETENITSGGFVHIYYLLIRVPGFARDSYC
jgi:hypothetical protein